MNQYRDKLKAWMSFLDWWVILFWHHCNPNVFFSASAVSGSQSGNLANNGKFYPSCVLWGLQSRVLWRFYLDSFLVDNCLFLFTTTAALAAFLVPQF